MIKKYQSSSALFWRRARKKLQGIVAVFREHRLKLVIVVTSFVVVVAMVGFVRSLISGPKLMIGEVDVEVDQIGQLYHYEPLVGFLKKDFEHKNSVYSWFRKRSLFRYYKKHLPWISDINLDVHNTGAVVTVYGRAPTLFIQSQDQRFALVNAVLVLINSPKQYFDSGESATGFVFIPSIQLLDTQSSGNTLHGLFYGIGPARFEKQVKLIVDNIRNYESIAYIPGSYKIILTLRDNVELYFDLEKNVISQLDKYKKIIGSGGLQGYRKIDIGTMDNVVFMSK